MATDMKSHAGSGWMFGDGVVFCPAHADLVEYDGTVEDIRTWEPIENHIQRLSVLGLYGIANPLMCHWCTRVYGKDEAVRPL